MKRSCILLCFVSLLAAPGLNGQKPIKVIEDSVQFGNYLYPGFNVTIPEADYDRVLKNWVKSQETGTKSKVQTENGEMTIFGALVKQITPAPVNIYSRLMNEDTLTRLLVAIELKKDQYVEPASGDIQLTTAKNFLKEFAKDQYIDFIKDELAAEEKSCVISSRSWEALKAAKPVPRKRRGRRETLLTMNRRNCSSKTMNSAFWPMK